MSKNEAYVRAQAGDAVVQASGDALGSAVAVTDAELLIGRAGLFGWGANVRRHPLAALNDVQVLASGRVNVLRLAFDGPQPQVVTVMFSSDESATFDSVSNALQASVLRRPKGASNGR